MTLEKGSFYVFNDTSDTITTLTASHAATGHTTEIITADSLAVGASTKKKDFASERSSADQWTISFTRNNKIYGGHCDCAFRMEYGGITMISVHDDHWNVEMSNNSKENKCMHKSYNGN